MQFAQPFWLLAGLATCAFLLWRYRKFETLQRATLARFAAVHLLKRLTLSVSPARRKAKQALFILGVFCLFVALARPQAGYERQEVHRKGLELLFAVDTSKSMLAQDVKPDRLSRAKLAVHDLLDRLNGDAVGLVAFAGNAFLQCPMTLDYDAFRESLDALDTKVIPRGGTDIAAAIREAEALFKTRTAAEKILILITDGEDLGGEGIAAAKEAARNGVKIFAVGVGSTTGELVPVPSENGGTDFAKDASGQLVKSHLDEATLKQIAEVTGGLYQPLGQQGEGLSAIYDQGLGSFTRHDLSARQAKVFLEQFHWALLFALGCFIAEMLIGTRRKVRQTKTARTPVRAKPAWAHRHATAVLGIALLGATTTTRAALPQAAEQAYKQGDFTKSQADTLRRPEKNRRRPNSNSMLGRQLIKPVTWRRRQPISKTVSAPRRYPCNKALIILGNTQFRLGQKSEKSNPKETIGIWGQAVRSYDAALQIEPGDTQARHNRDLVKHNIERLKKQEDQKKQQQQQQTGSEKRFQRSEERSQEPANRPERPGTEGSEAAILRTSKPVRTARSRRIRSSSNSRIRRAIPKIRRAIPRTSRPVRMARNRRIRSSNNRIRRASRPTERPGAERPKTAGPGAERPPRSGKSRAAETHRQEAFPRSAACWRTVRSPGRKTLSARAASVGSPAR